MAKGSVRNRGLDTWQVRWEGPILPNGKRDYRSITVKGKKADAEMVLRERLREVDQGIYVKPGKESLSEFIERWFRDYGEVNLRARTLEE